MIWWIMVGSEIRLYMTRVRRVRVIRAVRPARAENFGLVILVKLDR